MSIPSRASLATIAAAAALLLAACGGADGPGACDGLSAGQQVGGATLTEVATVADVDGGRAYCKVAGSIAPQTAFVLQLPVRWRQRYLHLGGGSFDGVIPTTSYGYDYLQGGPTALSRGFAVAMSNGGHSSSSKDDASWALGQPVLLHDFGSTAIAKVDTAARAIIAAHYGQPPTYAYFDGCSSGGREALQAAALFGQGYDGVVAGSPDTNESGKTSARDAIYQRFLVPANRLSAFKVAALERATLAACDGLDGLADGLIANPAACRFDPAALLCPGGETDDCLTAAQADSVRLIRGDTRLADGTVVHSGWGLGAEALADGVSWMDMFTGDPAAGKPAASALEMANRLRYFDFGDPAYDPATYVLDRDYPAVLAADVASDLNVDPVRLAGFVAAGKKMIVWNGASDYAISVNNTARFYGLVGAAAGAAPMAASARLFSLAGVHHCGGGAGADSFDMLAAITDWVELGQAPDHLVATKYDPATGRVQLTRPLCAHPQFPRYNGSGDPNQASSFTCSGS